MINLLDSDEEDFVPDEPVNPYDQKTEIEPLVRTQSMSIIIHDRCKNLEGKKYPYYCHTKKRRQQMMFKILNTNKQMLIHVTENGNN